jgi:hypothetical protein
MRVWIKKELLREAPAIGSFAETERNAVVPKRQSHRLVLSYERLLPDHDPTVWSCIVALTIST